MSDQQLKEILRETVKQHPDALSSLPDTTRDRYEDGQFPRAVFWFLKHPKLLKDLAKKLEKCPPQIEIPS